MAITCLFSFPFFSNRHTVEALLKHEHDFPIIGRQFEIAEVMKLLRTHKNESTQGQTSLCSMVVIEGPTGIGRSRLMDAIVVKIHQEKIKLVISFLSCVLSPICLC